MVVAAVFLAMATRASALQINVNDAEIPGRTPHVDDPMGDELTRIVEAAAQHDMDIIGDTNTLNIAPAWAGLNDSEKED